MQASSRRIYGQVIYLAAAVLATVFALSCLWEIELESWTMRVLGIRYEPSFESAERWRFILTSTGFAAIALIVPSVWVARSLRIQRDGYRALKREQAKREELARHDPLTGLFNRRLFNEHLAEALDNKDSATAIFLVGLDRFKRINDTYGHAVGDKVLCEIAERLREIANRSAACVARIGGDEFALIVYDDNRRSLTALANDILAALCAPIAFLERSTSVGATMGISVAHVDAVQPDTLIHCAEHAMSRGKSGARATFHFYDPSYEQAQQQASQFESDLLLAVTHEHIEPFFNRSSACRNSASSASRSLLAGPVRTAGCKCR
jgi:diguanylate cyclase (GGDEF)-like protein